MKKVNLIALGTGHLDKKKFKLSSNSMKIIRNSSVPVWVIENESVTSPANVLCPIDFSEQSMLALDNAIKLCRIFDSKLLILNVVKGIDKEYTILGADTSKQQAEIVKSHEIELEELIKGLDLSGITYGKLIKLGDPVDVVLDVIKEEKIDLLMMGSTGKGAFKRLFLGSTAERVVCQVPCSFIINKREGMIQLKLEKEITDIEIIYAEGVQLAKHGFIKEAIVEWERCIQKNELYFKAWSAIVKAYKSMGDTNSAEKFNASRERIQRVLWDSQIEADLRSKLYHF